MPSGPTPTVSVSGRNVVVSWSGVSLPDSTAITTYRVARYETSDVAQTIGASCDGTVSGLTCTETAVPAGTWKYRITPKRSQWLGGAGAESPDAVVAAPSLSLSPTTISVPPSTLTGSVASFITGETITFRLDDPSSGTVLSGSVSSSPIPFSGSSSVSVTIPASTASGAHTVYAIGSQGSQASRAITVSPYDIDAPTVSRAVIAKSTGGVGAYVRQGGRYFVYAQVADTGNPATGVSTVRSNLSTVTTGATSVALSPGSYSIEGASYNYRSAVQTASNPLTAGSKSFSIAATDAGGNSTTASGFSVTVHNTPPAGSDVQTTNVSGGTNGKAETGDSITFTFTEQVDPFILLSGWDGSATSVSVRLVQNGGGDRVQIYNASNSVVLPLGTLFLNRTDYVGGGTTSFTGSTMVMNGSVITIALGTPNGTTTTAAGLAR
jgi:hypothetical protein